MVELIGQLIIKFNIFKQTFFEISDELKNLR